MNRRSSHLSVGFRAVLVKQGSVSLPQFPRLMALEWSLIVFSSFAEENREARALCKECLLISGLGSVPREGKRPARKLFISQEENEKCKRSIFDVKAVFPVAFHI